jgi:hypothetical protein
MIKSNSHIYMRTPQNLAPLMSFEQRRLWQAARKQPINRADLDLHAGRVNQLLAECKERKYRQMERERIDARIRSHSVCRGKLAKQSLERDRLQRQKTIAEKKGRVMLYAKRKAYGQVVNKLFAPSRNESIQLKVQTREQPPHSPVLYSLSASPARFRTPKPRPSSPVFLPPSPEPTDWLGHRRRLRNQVLLGRRQEPVLDWGPLGSNLSQVRARTRALESRVRQQELVLSELDTDSGLDRNEQVTEAWLASAKAKLSVLIAD